MKKLTSLMLCISFAMLLFSGCKKIAENPPAASTEPTTTPTESISETIKPNTGPIITTRPTDPLPTTETTEPPVDPYPQYVQTAICETIICQESSYNQAPQAISILIPKLLPFSEDAIACQEEIQNHFEPLLEQERKNALENSWSMYHSIDYSVYLNDTILSLVIRENSMVDLISFHVYNFDVESGKRLDTDALIEKLEMDDYTEKLTYGITVFYEYKSLYRKDREKVKKYLELNISEENLSEAIPYVADNFLVMAVVKMYFGAGAECYPTEIPVAFK